MFRKINIKQVSIVFILLLAIVVVLFIIEPSRNTRSSGLREMLFEGDTAEISKISIYKQGELENQVSLVKKDGRWMVKSVDAYYNVSEPQIKNMLNIIQNLQPKRIAATKKDRWKEFQVTDSLSTRVIAETDKKTVLDLHIGKFSYQQPKNPSPYNYQQRGTMSTYVRLNKDKSVYVVDGFLSMSFNKDAKDFRSHTLVKSNYENWTNLNLISAGINAYQLTNQNGKWLLNGIMADSAKTTNYLKTLANLNSYDFVDDQKPLSDQPAYTLNIEGNNFTSPITLQAYLADSTHALLITSSQNKGVYFSGKKSGLFDKIFPPKESFFEAVVPVEED